MVYIFSLVIFKLTLRRANQLSSQSEFSLVCVVPFWWEWYRGSHLYRDVLCALGWRRYCYRYRDMWFWTRYCKKYRDSGFSSLWKIEEIIVSHNFLPIIDQDRVLLFLKISLLQIPWINNSFKNRPFGNTIFNRGMNTLANTVLSHSCFILFYAPFTIFLGIVLPNRTICYNVSLWVLWLILT